MIRKKNKWIDPWTLERIFKEYLETFYEFEPWDVSAERIAKMQYDIKRAYEDVELLYTVID